MAVSCGPEQRDITLAEVYEVVHDEFALYFKSVDYKRRTCINTIWKRLGMFWRVDMTLPADGARPRQCLTYEPRSTHTHTVVFLHGRDSTAHEFAKELSDTTDSQNRTLADALPGVKWVFPTAPITRCAKYGLHMSQWFDMTTTEDPHEGEEDQDPTEAIDIIHNQMAKEAAIVGWSNVILAGISQGAAVGIHALLKQPHKLGGFIGINTWLPRPGSIQHAASRDLENLRTPVMLAHNRDDQVIDVAYGEEMEMQLGLIGMNVDWHEYWTNMDNNTHWLNEPEGVDDLVTFVRRTRRGCMTSPETSPSTASKQSP